MGATEPPLIVSFLAAETTAGMTTAPESETCEERGVVSAELPQPDLPLGRKLQRTRQETVVIIVRISIVII